MALQNYYTKMGGDVSVLLSCILEEDTTQLIDHFKAQIEEGKLISTALFNNSVENVSKPKTLKEQEDALKQVYTKTKGDVLLLLNYSETNQVNPL